MLTLCRFPEFRLLASVLGSATGWIGSTDFRLSSGAGFFFSGQVSGIGVSMGRRPWPARNSVGLWSAKVIL
jgi:hypothetical protein